MNIRVTVWNENRVNSSNQKMTEIYPHGIHGTLAAIFRDAGFDVKTALLDDIENGLTDEILEDTDVLVYWSHIANNQLSDETADRVCRHVNRGMGFIPLHSALGSKPFKKLLGTSCTIKWRESDDRELIWCVNPAHPISEGIEGFIDLEHEETYSEYFDIPQPDELVFVSWFSGGEIFRSGCCFNRGKGRIFYFQPGHETLPTYHNKQIQKVLINAVRWAFPCSRALKDPQSHCVSPALEK